MTIFLDRDGTINKKRPEGDYVKNWTEFEFLDGALEGIRVMTKSGARIVCVTNQRGIARGRMKESDLQDIHARMLSAIDQAGGRIDAIYHCPHESGCTCRKPHPGLFEQARSDYPLTDFRDSIMMGDSISDMAAAAAIGSRAVLIGNWATAQSVYEEAASRRIRIDFHAATLRDAARELASRGLIAS